MHRALNINCISKTTHYSISISLVSFFILVTLKSRVASHCQLAIYTPKISVFPLVDNSPTKQDGKELERLITETNNDDNETSLGGESKDISRKGLILAQIN